MNTMLENSGAFPELINVTQLADMLSLSVRTVWRLNSAGKLPKPLRLGRSAKWRKNEILDWLANDCPSRFGDAQ